MRGPRPVALSTDEFGEVQFHLGEVLREVSSSAKALFACDGKMAKHMPFLHGNILIGVSCELASVFPLHGAPKEQMSVFENCRKSWRRGAASAHRRADII
jgi:hypothetical protein